MVQTLLLVKHFSQDEEARRYIHMHELVSPLHLGDSGSEDERYARTVAAGTFFFTIDVII